MEILEYILGGLLAVLAIALIVLVGKQQGKRRGGLSNSIAGVGASESYLAKNKIGGKKESYQKWTLIVAIVFVILVLALYIVGSVEPADDTSATSNTLTSTTESSTATESSAAVESSEAPAESSEAPAESAEAPAESAATSEEASK